MKLNAPGMVEMVVSRETGTYIFTLNGYEDRAPKESIKSSFKL